MVTAVITITGRTVLHGTIVDTPDGRIVNSLITTSHTKIYFRIRHHLLTFLIFLTLYLRQKYML